MATQSHICSSSASDSSKSSRSESPSTSASSMSLSTSLSPPGARCILLPSPVFANSMFLGNLAATLEKGAGDLLFLCIRGGDSNVGLCTTLKQCLAETRSLVDVSADASWTEILAEVEGKKMPYFMLNTADSTTDQCEAGTFRSLDRVLTDCKLVSYKGFPVPTYAEAMQLFSLSSFRCVFSRDGDGFTIYVLERPAVTFPPLIPSPCFTSNPKPQGTPFGVPALSEWHDLWATWDLVTLGMIPSAMLHQKPIDLRHKCLFYIGHIPTFLDMLMSKALKEPNTEPKNFTVIFERGIDPHVDDPDHCHSHSEVPDADEDWPILEEILAYRDRVRARLTTLYKGLQSGEKKINRNIARMLVMTFEHEGFHVETLLYMLIQRAGTGTLPPPGFMAPPWSSLAIQWAQQTPALAMHTTTLGPATVILGHDDSEAHDNSAESMKDVDGHEFGWDNESPQRSVEVSKFKIDWRPVSNAEFYIFWLGDGKELVNMPRSWTVEHDEIKIRTLYGPVSMDIAKDWPVLTSYDDLALFAQHKGGRIPTEPELRLFFDTYDVGHKGGSNVGFRNWHPVPATTGGGNDSGRGINGGVWEWTMTIFKDHEGLSPTNHFTGYSTDFFDGKHQVVLGASYATIPRLASRRTIRNFYQHNYPYPWVGARVAYDFSTLH